VRVLTFSHAYIIEDGSDEFLYIHFIDTFIDDSKWSTDDSAVFMATTVLIHDHNKASSRDMWDVAS
jgi:hypothetical protein